MTLLLALKDHGTEQLLLMVYVGCVLVHTMSILSKHNCKASKSWLCNCLIVGKLFNLSVSLIICKVGLIIVPAPPTSCWH